MRRARLSMNTPRAVSPFLRHESAKAPRYARYRCVVVSQRGVSAAAVVPGIASASASQRATTSENRPRGEGQYFQPLPTLPRETLQSPRQLNLLGSVEPEAESAELSKRRGLAEDERARHPRNEPAQGIPAPRDGAQQPPAVLEGERAATGKVAAAANRTRDIGEQLRTWVRIGVHEHQPVAARARRAGVARTI